MSLELAVVRIPSHEDIKDRTPTVLLSLDLRSALKDHIVRKKLTKRALRLLDEAFTAVEDNLKHQTTTL